MNDKNRIKTHGSPEEELDLYIDSLNQELRPEESEESEAAELQALVRQVKSLRPPREPNAIFTAQLGAQVMNKQNHGATRNQSQSRKGVFSTRFFPGAALVASLLVVVFLFSPWSKSNQNIVSAMEQTVKQLQNYHGTLEKISRNEASEEQLQARTEIWSEGSKYATRNEEGVLTVNNGESRWVTQPQSQEVTLLPIYLDPHDFDLRKEADKALRYPHTILGEETVAGRTATRLEITPPGGLPYYLWIDSKTFLPIQLQTAMQKSLQTTYTFVSLETNIDIPATTFAYTPPAGYRIVDQNPDKLVSSLTEGIAVSGLTPLQPSEQPKRIFASVNRLVLDFEDTVIIQTKATSPLSLNPVAALGQAAGGTLEILDHSLRWQQNDLEIKVQGQRYEELAKQLTDTLVFTPPQTPQENQISPDRPTVSVDVNMEIVKNNQQQVDAGSSPWQLDPVQVAFTFAILQISPEGITGEPPLDYKTLRLTANNGRDAVVQASEGPVKTIYLKRLVRQDESGIWTVIGYDPR